MTATAAFARLYWKLETLIDPGVVSSQYVYRDVVDAAVTPDTDWLDLGCGHSLFPDWIRGQSELVDRARSTAGIDYTVDALGKHSSIRRLVAGDITALPFASQAFDVISSNMVMEHLRQPVPALAEIARILRPGGRLIFHTPNLWFYQIRLATLVPDRLKRRLVAFGERRADSDIFPTYYQMNTARAIHTVARRAGFRVIELRKVNTSSISDIFLFGPFVVGALLFRRMTRLHALQDFRSNFIVTLEKALPKA